MDAIRTLAVLFLSKNLLTLQKKLSRNGKAIGTPDKEVEGRATPLKTSFHVIFPVEDNRLTA